MTTNEAVLSILCNKFYFRQIHENRVVLLVQMILYKISAAVAILLLDILASEITFLQSVTWFMT